MPILQRQTHPNQPNESHTYDDVGNRTASHQGSSYSYQPFNRLVSANGTTFGYDPNGNQTSKSNASGSWAYVWDYENRLKQASLSGGVSVTYSYDALGRRIQRTSSVSGTERFVYDGADVVRDLDGSNATVADYLNALGIDNKLRQTTSSITSYFITDHLGTTRGLSDATGILTSGLSYDSFGNFTGGSASTRYTYTGREADAETGLMYYRARWYDRQQGRFISEDPVGFDSGVNWYTYVENNPVASNDPSGLRPLPRSRTGTRPCKPDEMAICVKTCGARGVQSCRVSQTLRVVRWRDGKTYWKWVDGPLSCSCNDCEPKNVRRLLNVPTMDELRMQEESARQMYEFWKKVTIGGYLVGGVLTGGALFGGGATVGLIPVLVP